MKKRLFLFGCILLLVAQLGVQLYLARHDSQTTDEGVHISAGYTYITRGDFRFNPEHPPLVKILAALPLLAIKPNINSTAEGYWNQSNGFFYDSWRENRAFGEQLLYDSGNNPSNVLFAARLPNVIITFLLGLTILLITRKHWGEFAALVAVSLYSTNPIVNGHGHLVTTDVPLALTFLLTTYYGWRFFETPSWKGGIWLGIFAGLALLTKHTAVILFPALFVMLLVGWYKQRATNAPYFKNVIPKLIIGLIVVWAMIWAGFGFHDRIIPKSNSVTTDVSTAKVTDLIEGNGYNTITTANTHLDKIYKVIRPIFMFLPGDYVKGVFLVFSHVNSGQSSFLLGQLSYTGWWYYFPALMLFKIPIPSLILFGMAIYYVFKIRPVNWTVVGLLSAAGVFLGVAMLSKANLGIRHVLPVITLLIFVSAWAAIQNEKFKPFIYALLIWSVVIFIATFPTYLGYFNELAGGNNNGYKIATDSNLDWGQDLYRIRDYVKANNLTNIYTEYNWDGLTSMDYYFGKGNYHQLQDWQPGEKGTAIIGASAFDGPNYINLKNNCVNGKMITNAVFTCELN